MTAQNGDKKTQPVNPVLLVILGIVVIGGGIYYYASGYLTQPTVSVEQPKVTATQVPQVTPNPDSPSIPSPSDNNNELTTEKAGASLADASPTGSTVRRDPFEPSVFYNQISGKDNSGADSKLVTVSSTGAFSSKSANSSDSSTSAGDLSWEGVITAGNNDQVIIIRYQDKPYSLRLGEKVPGTAYIVGQINQSSVILMAPKGKLQLNRKKEAR